MLPASAWCLLAEQIMPFLSELHMRRIPGRFDVVSLTAPVRYQGRFREFVVPEGFVTDGASVPRALWSFFPPWGPWLEAAVLHDYLYVSGIVSRADADGLFRRAMRELGVGKRRWLMYSAVRSFGWIPWRKRHRKP